MYRRVLQESLPAVQARLEQAARRVGRDPSQVRIVAVTKAHPMAAVEAALEAGLRDLGENRLAELKEKAVRVDPGEVDWHMVGSLQRRTAPQVRGIAALVHSLDSLRLAERLERTAGDDHSPLAVLVQVNVSGEPSKSGFSPADLLPTLVRLTSFDSLEIRGLMTMAPYTVEESVLRSCFRGLRRLQEEAEREIPEYRGRELSMGMSNDFDLAVEEGATIVRIGSALFGERPA